MGLEPTSGFAATCFQDRPLIRPVGFRWNRTEFRGLESNQRPPRSERGVTTNSHCPGVIDEMFAIREGGVEPPPPDSKSGSLPISRFPRASCGSRTHVSGLEGPCLCRSAKDARKRGGRRGSRTLKALRSPEFESGAVANRLALPRLESTGGRSRTSNRRLNRAPPYRSATPVLFVSQPSQGGRI